MKSMAVALDRFAETTCSLVSWATLLMVLITFVVVVLRYVFDLGWISLQESVTYLHAAVFMLGAAYTMKHQGHVRVDIFYQKMDVRGRAWVDTLGTLLLLLPVCVFVFWVSWVYVADSWRVLEGSREAGGLPAVFLLKTLMLLLPLTLGLQGLIMLVRNISLLRHTTAKDKIDD